ncbi:MAG TPA: LD-carboxypeptidase [Thermoanaerobaculia bacterium]|jgi:muramoyltetrapeptide carboxypeptidase|nr:LD-carboxypeptidase [Thermoanaerobaculia bacterium]
MNATLDRASGRASSPPAVVPGDLVGVAALSSVADRDALAAGLRQLEELGFEVRPARNLRSDWLGFAGRDQERLDAFHELVAAPEVKAIFFSRGGHGLLRILPGIDWGLLARHPKAYVGYSDLVPLLLQIVTRLRLVCFHGPMVASDLHTPLDPSERESLLGALAGRLARSIPCDLAPDARPLEGPLLGGCLAMLVATLGTPWFPRLDGSLLFLEDVNEPLYRLDRMLTQLQLSGKLRRVKGMILGHLAAEDGGDPELWLRLRERSTAVGRRGIVAWNLPGGHGRPNLTLPLGAIARLDPEAGALVIDDGAPRARA